MTTDAFTFSFQADFEARTDLAAYGANALSIYAIQHYWSVENIESFAADSITDGGNDKKIDICAIDVNLGRALICQSSLSPNWGKTAAKANKAGELTIGVGWLLSADIDTIPAALRPKAEELRKGIIDGEIKKLELLFIHNALASKNVKDELAAARSTAYDLVQKIAPNTEISVVAHEFGLKEIDDLYKSNETDIVIEDWLELPVNEFIERNGKEWKSIITSIPATWIREMANQHGAKLVSANFRDYLGARAAKGNINHQIKQTIASEPENFWVFNNGITALTHEIRIDKETKTVKIRGISIINGAQTSGSLGESDYDDAETASVLFRVVASKNETIVDKIIRFNNTQNKIVPTDQRSNAKVLKGLEETFGAKGLTFVIRRSNSRNSADSFFAADIARLLAAFHGDPQLGYRNPSSIFDEDKVFDSVFSPEISMEHVYLLASLAHAYDLLKAKLVQKVVEEKATKFEQDMYEVLKFTASRYFIVYLMGAIKEELVGKRVPSLYLWKSKEKYVKRGDSHLSDAWQEILNSLLPQIKNIVLRQGGNAAFEVPRSGPLSEQVAQELQSQVLSFVTNFEPAFEKLRPLTHID